MTFWRLSAILLSYFILQAATAIAAPISSASVASTAVSQSLDSSRSSIQVGLRSQLVQVDGTFNDYSGLLLVDPTDFAKSRLRVQFDLSKAKLNARANGAAYPVDGLLQGMRVSKGVFQSTRIVDKGNSRYLVSGTFTRGAQQRNVSVPVRLVSFKPGESRIEISINGPVEDLDSDISLPQLFGPTQANVSGTLVFNAASASTNSKKR